MSCAGRLASTDGPHAPQYDAPGMGRVGRRSRIEAMSAVRDALELRL
jgi:hypothetical protein